MVRRADGVLVVLDHEHGVAEIAQVAERGEQPLVVALVQPDARLVQHVEHAGEPGADLGREPDALRLAAGERARRAAQREVVEPDVPEEAEPVADFLEDRARRPRRRGRGRPIGSRLALERAGRRRTRRPRVTGRSTTSPMPLPPTWTASDSGLSRLPPQARQGSSTMNCSSAGPDRVAAALPVAPRRRWRGCLPTRFRSRPGLRPPSIWNLSFLPGQSVQQRLACGLAECCPRAR